MPVRRFAFSKVDRNDFGREGSFQSLQPFEKFLLGRCSLPDCGGLYSTVGAGVRQAFDTLCEESLRDKGEREMRNYILSLVVCVLLVGLGYGLNSLRKPAGVAAQGPGAAANRFQVLTTKEHGDILVDTLRGRVFDFTSGGPNGGQILQERPIRACAINAECTAWKRESDAQ